MVTGRDTILETDAVKDAFLTKLADDLVELFATKTEVENARDGSATLLAQIDSLQALIAALTANGLYVACTSGTRPAFGGISNGVMIYETDTDNFYFADVSNTKWIVPLMGNKYASGSFPAAGATYDIHTGTEAYDTTNSLWMYYNGASWINNRDTYIEQNLKDRFLI